MAGDHLLLIVVVTVSASCRIVKPPSVVCAELHQDLLVLLEALAGKPEEHQHDAHVDDVAAVAARVRPTRPIIGGHDVGPVARLRTFAPRQNSCTIVPTTNAQNAKQSPEAQMRMPSAYDGRAGDDRRHAGQRNRCTRFDDRRLAPREQRRDARQQQQDQADRQHPLVEERRTDRQPLPVIASLSVGNIVANRTKNAENNSIQLLKRNAASRETHESSSLRALQ